jgi:diketogulonate reductase-like aldo/keto reductase
MVIPTKKLKNGFEMPVLGLGTWQMGGGADNRRDPANDDQRDIAAIKAAISLGITHIDSAESYAEGHSEELVGEGIKGTEREKLFLVSKVRGNNLNYNGIKSAIKNSLKRLGTDYLDLYLMHRCPPQELMEECVRAMDELIEEGLTRFIGLSDTNTRHTRQLQELSKHKFVAAQAHYNLVIREVEKEGLLNYCQQNDMLLIAWRPVQMGITNYEKIPGINEMTKKYNKTPTQIAICWLISQKNVVTLSKTSSIKHLKENLGAVGWPMETEDVERLRKEFPNQKFISDTVPLA